MNKDEELWREFAPNGQAKDIGWPKKEYEKLDKICASSHVWVWRRASETDGDIEMLMQLRSSTTIKWPNHWDASAVGHINVGETTIAAAIREAKEEINLEIDAKRLEYIFSDRHVSISKLYEEFRHIFLYELTNEPDLKFNDGEVAALKWIPLPTLKNWIENPENYSEKIRPGAAYYFTQLFEWLERTSKKKGTK